MSDTPETDAEIIWFGGWEDNRYVPAGFARKLERERDEAISALAEKINCCHDEPCSMLVFRLERERNSEHARTAHYRDQLHAAIRERNEAHELNSKLLREFAKHSIMSALFGDSKEIKEGKK